MKRNNIFILLAILLAMSVVAYAADHAPKAIKNYNVTKSHKHSVKGMPVVTVSGSKATTAYLNGTGGGWLVGAGAERDFFVFRNISSITFMNASTSAADPNVLRIMEH